ncbi:MAG TPA: ribonuclease G [Gammaproteobacteria bacterium]|nr:ribonuclease G [Gammaproteobacteria bacterium]
MSEEILINVTPQETRVALVENGVLQEVFIERSSRHGIVGNIYKGRVLRVLPGMQAAFVEVGLERSAFLHASDIATSACNAAGAVVADAVGGETSGRRSIEHLLHEGQEVLVQVIKDPLGSKGARLSTQISIPSRYLVFMPGLSGVGVSAKIEDEEERHRLRELLREMVGESPGGGYIVRTAGERATGDALRNDASVLDKVWQAVQAKAARAEPGGLVHGDLPLVLRILRDLLGSEVERLRIDSREVYREVARFVQTFLPESATRIEHYPGERPIFDLFGVEDEIQRALDRKVPLKSGGYLIIDQTESMTTIDINTGAFVGHRNLEETIFKTNLEAAHALARQLRLRNLGGIIIIDFIDMQDTEHRRQVVRTLEAALEKDYAKTKVCEVSPLGLVEMTRKRTRESLERILCEPCPACDGRGFVKTAETVCHEIFRELLREAHQFEASELRVLAAQEVIDRFLDEEAQNLAELEECVGKPIRLQVEAMYDREQFDVVLM